MMRDLPVKKILYWCDNCDVPLIGRQCGCRNTGRAVPLLPPYDVRPAMLFDRTLLSSLILDRFGGVVLPDVVLLNKTGGVDRNDLVIIHGERLGWLSFDPVSRKFRFDIAPEGIPYVLPHASKGIVDLDRAISPGDTRMSGRIGGKRFRVTTDEPDGTVIVKFRKRFGTGVLKNGYLKVKELGIPPRKEGRESGLARGGGIEPVSPEKP